MTKKATSFFAFLDLSFYRVAFLTIIRISGTAPLHLNRTCVFGQDGNDGRWTTGYRKTLWFREECEAHVDHFRGALFQKFDSKEKAETFLKDAAQTKQILYVVARGDIPGIYWEW